MFGRASNLVCNDELLQIITNINLELKSKLLHISKKKTCCRPKMVKILFLASLQQQNWNQEISKLRSDS